ncbi:hypothetical protein A5734_18540 [Mycolicibacterium fortuitum]|nr:hypothetical protein A5734_18540 [Mycolicibacterium fortuitum]
MAYDGADRRRTVVRSVHAVEKCIECRTSVGGAFRIGGFDQIHWPVVAHPGGDGDIVRTESVDRPCHR